jgi:glutamate-1-semialdehyde aminotransferase
MLPPEDSLWVGEELSRRFGLPYWQATLTATDANRFAIRLARHITKRPRILVFAGVTTGRSTRPSRRCATGSSALATATSDRLWTPR